MELLEMSHKNVYRSEDMQSLYARYLSEREGLWTFETEYGFVTYRILDGHGYAELIDMYIVPEQRNSGKAWDLLYHVEEEAANKACKYLFTCVDPQAKNSHNSMLAVLAGGFILHRTDGSLIWFFKEIR